MAYSKNDSPVSNKVYLDERGLIVVSMNGPQNAETIKDTRKRIEKFLDQLESEGKPKLLLVDIGGVTGQNLGARREGSKFFKLPFDKEAMYGAKPYITIIAKLAIKGANAEDRVAVFKTRQEALEWLTGELPSKTRN